MVQYYSQITINSAVIDEYLYNYDVQINEVFADEPNFTAVSGKLVQAYLGDQRVLNVNFEPMTTAQLNTLFKSIKASRNNISIKYIDPKDGETTKKFSCTSLPAATHFVSDDGRQFWTIPTVTFEEVVDFSGGSG